MDSLNQLFGFCPRRFLIANEQDIVTNCEWNAWCIDAHKCSDGCGVEQARSQFGTTKCHAASRPFCQLTRLAKSHTDEANPYWSVGCGSNRYSIHDYLLDEKAALATSVLATTSATISTATVPSIKAPHVQAPVATISTLQPVIPTSSGPPLALPTNNPPSSSSSSGASAIPSASTTTSPTPDHPGPQTSDTHTYISSANTATEEQEEAQKRHNPKSAILGSVIGGLAIIYILLFAWWYRGPRRRKREREARQVAERALREREFWRPPNGFEATGVTGPNKIQWVQGPQEEIHELGFGTMTKPKTPRLPEMPNSPQTPKTPYDTLQTKTGNESGKGDGLLGFSPLSPMVLSSRWDGTSQATSAGSSQSRVTSTNPSGSFKSKFTLGRGGTVAESGIFGFGGIGKPAKVATTATTIKEAEIAELDGRHMTSEERDRKRSERLEGPDLANQPARWEGRESSGGNSGGTFGVGGRGSNGTPGAVTRSTIVPPTESYMGQKAEDEQRGTIHVGWSPFDGK
ncbi:hypothetical protein QBC32DRAFT_350509 [Pseudoneurospora amorphoporcata]|uniref:Uncharacterized protein n=1 Tax=Pseudoneurospora amorphoporcata TaxID=241081 RepID=A0AAN6NMZ4_9PEZI|nr:hypothetical protein QBC32DRAFT_350509 [Pseudoneurospora amorphoporcata]